METVPRLPDEYLEKAREMVARHKNKKNCKRCYDRGYLGVDQNNLLVPCAKCVAADALLAEWRQFVRDTPELHELYGDYFEEEEKEQSEGAQDSPLFQEKAHVPLPRAQHLRSVAHQRDHARGQDR